MTIASAIQLKQQQVADAYTAISNKGGTLPATQNLANMPTAINSITGLVGETRTEQLNSTSGNTYTPSSGYNGIVSITVTPKNYARTVAPQTTPSVWAVPSGYSGHGNITVSAVTASIDANITAGNIKKDVQILGVTGTYEGGGSTKYGCTIDNLLGDVDANGVLQLPANTSGDIVFTGVKKIANNSLAYKFIYRRDITHGVSFPDLEEINGDNGARNMFQQCLYITSVSLPELITISGLYGAYYMFYNCTHITSALVLPKLTIVSGDYGAGNMFAYCDSLTSVSLPELTTVSGSYGASSMFIWCSSLTSFSAPKLKTLSGSSCLDNFFYNCHNLTTIDLSAIETADAGSALRFFCGACYALPEMRFTKLNSIKGPSVLSYAFTYCRAITDIYFNALTTTSFGSYVNQFNIMFNSDTASTSGNVNVHFPSNLQSTIQGLTGYPLFGGTNGRITLLFDLPATS